MSPCRYLLSLVDWRNAVIEESQALLDGTIFRTMVYKTSMVLIIIVLVSLVEFTCVNLVIDGLGSVNFWIAMLFDMASLTMPAVYIAVWTRVHSESAQSIGALPLILMLFLSTTFSPGAGVAGLKELRYLFTRYYFWCMVPGVQFLMEGCPKDETTNVFYLVLSSFNGMVVCLAFSAFKALQNALAKNSAAKVIKKQVDDEFHEIQKLLYGQEQSSCCGSEVGSDPATTDSSV
jgi:hypothetical protein